MSTVVESSPPVFAELTPPLGHAAALLEADRCLECGGPYAQAPCVVACPANVDVPGFVAAVARDDTTEAGRIIFAENLFGGTCGRVCPVELLCEGACVLRHEGRKPVAVGRLQRYRNRQRVGIERAAPEARAVQLAPGCSDRRRPRGSHVRRRARCARLRRNRLRRAARARRSRALRDRALPTVAEPLSYEARVLAELGVSFELGVAIDTARGARLDRRGRRCSRARGRHGRRRRRPLSGRRAPGRMGVAPVHRGDQDRACARRRRVGGCRRRRQHRGRRGPRSAPSRRAPR